MKNMILTGILLAGAMIGSEALTDVQAQAITMTSSDNEMMGNQVIKDEGYGNADSEYYGSKDDLVNDDLTNEQK